VSRYLDIQAQGVVEWLTRPATSAEQLVFAGLAQVPHSVPLETAVLAKRFGLEIQDFARVLFELNRRKSIVLTQEEQDHSVQFDFDFAALSADLNALSCGQPQLMLVTSEGLCIAQQGLSDEECTRHAADCQGLPESGWPVVMPLHLGQESLWLCSKTPIDTSGDALLRLVRRFLGLATPLRANTRAPSVH